MKHKTPGEQLRSARLAKGLSQLHVASMVGTSQVWYSHWERDARRIPPEFIEPLSATLEVDLAALVARGAADEAALSFSHLGRPGYRAPMMPPYDIKGTLEEMLRLGFCAEDVHYEVSRRVPAPLLGRLESCFPRDTATELLCVYHALNHGFRLTRSTLQGMHCPVLAVEGLWSARTAAHYLRDMLVLEKGDMTLAMVPQVWVPSIVQAEWYRLDFLAMVRRRDGEERWADVEIDGGGHELNREGDQRRARGIPVPRLGYWNRVVQAHDFGERLLRDLYRLLEKPALPFVTRR